MESYYPLHLLSASRMEWGMNPYICLCVLQKYIDNVKILQCPLVSTTERTSLTVELDNFRSFLLKQVPVSIADLGGTEIDLRFASPKEGRLFVIVAPVKRFSDGELHIVVSWFSSNSEAKFSYKKIKALEGRKTKYAQKPIWLRN